jgi:hypothetical protein
MQILQNLEAIEMGLKRTGVTATNSHNHASTAAVDDFLRVQI